MAEAGPDAGPSTARRRAGVALRAPVLAVLAAALIIGGLTARSGGGPQAASPALSPAPEAAPSQALSSSWFCAGATDEPKGAGHIPGTPSGSVIIANSAGAAASGVVTIIGSNGTSKRVPVSIGAYGRGAVPEQLPAGSPWVGAVVDINAGSVAVEERIDSPAGEATEPCATAGATRWYFATGATLINAGVVISLLNPYPTDAVVSLSFTTSQGLEQPQAFQAVVVPPGGLVPINLGDQMRRRQAIATSIVAQSGRVVAWKTDTVTQPAAGTPLLGTSAAQAPLADPAAPVPGVTLTLGAPGPSTTWTWPDGDAGNGISEQYVIYNPGPQPAELRLAVDLAQGVAEPFVLSVGPYQVSTVVSSQAVRIPPGVEHSAVLVSTNGVPVVAERTVAASSPSALSGLGELPGGELAANKWLLPYFPGDTAHTGRVVVFNPSATPAQASLSDVDGSPQLGTMTVAAGRWSALPLTNLRAIAGRPLLLTASQPVYVESDYYGKSPTTGISLSFGVPLNP